mmetsp:Transcript_33316/g.84141  ORF Transcript_33316/g.84141 Transcript_33316/m.84141 type:complete len:388 (+) Transcript_33316:65-1228(+)|eukprot:CAMPEP_0173432644 /NCGR_PEP_ID=MMETSP1357-20121228/10370_1 /TAXON_ID=77926 /ORGANISM="Hemiselmis rufescens, Strain PCC563" /LENGTH=387 /DNA_ID=CAMNT_0014397267 /DNA_START=69 /DNA_END=1232 /DNA_ORIENTATION=+
MGARLLLLLGMLGAASSVAGLQPLHSSSTTAWINPTALPMGPLRHQPRIAQALCPQRAHLSGIRGAQRSSAFVSSGRAPLSRARAATAQREGGSLRLRCQEKPQEVDSDIEQAEAAEGLVQKYVLGGLAGVATAGFAGYCAYTGQSPVDVAVQVQQADVQQGLRDLVGYIEGLGPIGYLYFSAVYVVAEMLAIPAIPLAASAGYLFGAVNGTLIVLLSATVAAAGAFLIGRVLLRSWVENLIAGSRKFQAIDEAISRKGFQLVLLLRLSPLLPFSISNYLYGMTKVDFGQYVGGTLLGFAPGTLAFVMTGQVGREISGQGVGESSLPWYGYAAGAAGVVWVGSVVAKIAGNAIAEVEAESAQRLDAQNAANKDDSASEVEAEKATTL